MNPKIVFYIPRIEMGGAENIVLQYLEALNADGTDVSLLTDIKASSYLKSKKNIKFNVIDLVGFSNCLFIIKLFKLAIAIKKHNILTIVSNISNANMQVLFLKFLKLIPQKTRIICMEHSIPSLCLNQSNKTKDKIIFCLLKFLYKKSNTIICVSKACKKDIISHFSVPENICHVVYNPLDLVKIQTMSHENFSDQILMDEKTRIISTLSRLSCEKNIDFLIYAMNNVILKCKEKFKVIFLIIGDGFERKNLENIVITLGQEKNILFLGKKDNPYPYLKISHLFVFAGKIESFCLSIGEALALNKQIIALRSPGVEEVLENGKYGIISEDKIEVFTEHILSVIENPIKIEDHSLIERAKSFNMSDSLSEMKSIITKMEPAK